MLEETNKLWKLADRRTGMNILICDDEGWIISRNSPAMTAAGFVCRSPARAIAFCARIAATSNICEIP